MNQQEILSKCLDKCISEQLRLTWVNFRVHDFYCHKLVMLCFERKHNIQTTQKSIIIRNERKLLLCNQRAVSIYSHLYFLPQLVIILQKTIGLANLRRIIHTVSWHYTCSLKYLHKYPRDTTETSS